MTMLAGISANLGAFLDTIAWSELGAEVISGSDDGYNVVVGSTPDCIITFPSYAEHPRRYIPGMNSDAAGRYQFMSRWWPNYQRSMALPDFGKESQDRWAIQLINECHAMTLVEAGDIESAVTACSSRWSSFPGNSYGQHQQKIADLVAAFKNYGGRIGVTP